VRELLDSQLQRRGTLGERAGKHFGRLDFAPPPAAGASWRAHLGQANVRK
jgi:hypothetical protein